MISLQLWLYVCDHVIVLLESEHLFHSHVFWSLIIRHITNPRGETLSQYNPSKSKQTAHKQTDCGAASKSGTPFADDGGVITGQEGWGEKNSISALPSAGNRAEVLKKTTAVHKSKFIRQSQHKKSKDVDINKYVLVFDCPVNVHACVHH